MCEFEAEFAKIEAGVAYILTDDKGSRVMHVHKIFERRGEIYLALTTYEFVDEAKEKLVLQYDDWETVGQEVEYLITPLSDIQRYQRFQRCHINSPIDNSNPVIERNNSEPSFTVNWGLRCGDFFELRKLRNRCGNVEVDSGDLDRLTTPLRVHNYNCGIGGFTCGFNDAGFNVVLGTETDQPAFESWKVTLLLRRVLVTIRAIIWAKDVPQLRKTLTHFFKDTPTALRTPRSTRHLWS
jgi:hypothetical protein